MIEIGSYVPRKQRVGPKLRTCKICDINDCEDEEHFLVRCQKYVTQREALFREIKDLNVFFKLYSDAQKFVWLMSNEDVKIIRTVSTVVHQCNVFQNIDVKCRHCSYNQIKHFSIQL